PPCTRAWPGRAREPPRSRTGAARGCARAPYGGTACPPGSGLSLGSENLAYEIFCRPPCAQSSLGSARVNGSALGEGIARDARTPDHAKSGVLADWAIHFWDLL